MRGQSRTEAPGSDSEQWLRLPERPRAGAPLSIPPFAHKGIEGAIPARFERLAARCPARLAIKSRGGELTYGELNEASNRVAREIAGVVGGSGERVA
ncbi:MAG TPA: hypothetical protein VK689_01350, partial [Armatimonadota bacterium]|nr:hypothetical protein [Armatimonadota bacterium]